jgi:hypothetical protein
VRAATVIVATNAYSDELVPGLAGSIVAPSSLQIATRADPRGAAPKRFCPTAKRFPTRGGSFVTGASTTRAAC